MSMKEKLVHDGEPPDMETIPAQDLNSVQSSALQRAFSNALIFQKILSFLSPSDLLNLRPVSKMFEAEVTSFLISNKRAESKLHVKFTWAASKSPPDQGHYRHLYMGTLSEFLENCWKTSSRFPVPDFYFDNIHMTTKDLLDFFKAVGEHIKGLSLNPSSSSEHQQSSLQLLASILFEWTPNLTFLDLISMPWPSPLNLFDHTQLVPENRELSSLNILTLPKNDEEDPSSTRVVQDILESAPNLQQIHDSQLKFTEVLVACQKFHLSSKALKYNIYSGSEIRLLNFALARPQHLQEISLRLNYAGDDPLMWADIGRALTNIFQAGCQSLAKIGKLPFLQAIPNVEPLPIMEKVTKVEFYHNPDIGGWYRRGKILPEANTLRQVFPKLKTLELHNLIEDETLRIFRQGLDGDLLHDGVTTLVLSAKYDSSLQPKWIRVSSKLFSNITSLEIRKCQDSLPEILRAIWTHLQQLEHLKISVGMTISDLPLDQLPGEMDSVITGIPLEMCKQLRRNLVVKKDRVGENVDHLREFPFILNLHQLKTFCISFWRPTMDVHCKCLFTPVAIVYGFQLMFQRQQLRASLGMWPNFSYREEKGVCGVKVTEKELLIVG